MNLLGTMKVQENQYSSIAASRFYQSAVQALSGAEG
jgi:hypothetical protein